MLFILLLLIISVLLLVLRLLLILIHLVILLVHLLLLLLLVHLMPQLLNIWLNLLLWHLNRALSTTQSRLTILSNWFIKPFWFGWSTVTGALGFVFWRSNVLDNMIHTRQFEILIVVLTCAIILSLHIRLLWLLLLLQLKCI